MYDKGCHIVDDYIYISSNDLGKYNNLLLGTNIPGDFIEYDMLCNEWTSSGWHISTTNGIVNTDYGRDDECWHTYQARMTGSTLRTYFTMRVTNIIANQGMVCKIKNVESRAYVRDTMEPSLVPMISTTMEPSLVPTMVPSLAPTLNTTTYETIHSEKNTWITTFIIVVMCVVVICMVIVYVFSKKKTNVKARTLDNSIPLGPLDPLDPLPPSINKINTHDQYETVPVATAVSNSYDLNVTTAHAILV